jgi:hypothetical protein
LCSPRTPNTVAPARSADDDQGFGWLPQEDFVPHLTSGVEPARAKVLHAVQQPPAGSMFTDVMGVPAWKSLPTWHQVAAQNQAIPADAERLFASRMGATTVEIASVTLPWCLTPRR